jgi:hypothetical protein
MNNLRDNNGRFLKGITQPSAKVFKKGEHSHPTTEFKKGLVPWNKGKTYSNKGKGRHFSINTEFKSGNLHPNFKGGSTKYGITKSEWKKLQLKIKERDNFTCQSCHEKGTTKTLNVHHVVPYRYSKNNSEQNLTTLCIPCHTSIEYYTNQALQSIGATEDK